MIEAVRLEEVCRRYPNGAGLHPVSLSIGVGETVAIVGPSGAGKSTLLSLIAGVFPPDTGRVFLHGRLLADLAPGRELARLVGIVHQQFDLVPQLSVHSNVLAGRLGEWGLARSLLSLVVPQDAALAKRALERVGLLDRWNERTSRLSGGEQQRVALARLLVQNPRIILADEPVASLDPARAEDLLALLTGIAAGEGKTLIASLHSVALARRFFNRIVALRAGLVQFDRPAAEVADDDLAEIYALEDHVR
ncbi:MAG: phosphonates import ATP-binding protein PhnC 1 [Dehalococcoidia bacterium]|nr:MAG: phosphonates import ATP-binding protein PhnC 1 [Dehalococcoidia bacterium]